MQLETTTDRFVSGQIGQRYLVRELLGRGGMARVYRVYDTVQQCDVALKLWVGLSHKSLEQEARRASVSQFEYEYHTLAQLRHPCVIEVYDYGLGERGPYFTMELLDGGDLREHAPLPWRKACHLFYDICSSLALLHSRRLIHRDVSPRNVRCTQDCIAKLIDFGAMLPMGSSQQVVGTPAFVAPEVVQGLPLDGRVDLYSLGATLYFALTGKQASAARDFAQVLEFAQTKPPAPSRLVPEIPAALDALVSSLLEPDPALRPRSAFEVMQRLAAIARLEAREPVSVSQAYLSTPQLVARDSLLATLRERSAYALAGHGGTVVLEGHAGMGRSRLLDVCALWAKTLGATVVRGRGGPESALPRVILEQLIAVLPAPLLASERAANPEFDALFEPDPRPKDGREPAEPSARAANDQSLARARLRNPSTGGFNRKRVQSAIAHCALRASQRNPLVIAVDDIHGSDASTLRLLSELAVIAHKQRMLLVVTQDKAAAHGGWAAHAAHNGTSNGNGQRQRARTGYENALVLQIEPLTQDETASLFGSVFGDDVPHVALLSDRVHAVTGGNPGESLEIAQWLIERGLIRYEGGSWTLPTRIEVADLPACAADALRTRLASLSPRARELATAQALALRNGFGLADYRALATSSSDAELEAALHELRTQRVIEASDGQYALTQSARKVLCDTLTAEEARQRHRALAEYSRVTGKPTLHLVHHLWHGGEERQAIERLVSELDVLAESIELDLFAASQTSPEQTAAILLCCLDGARAEHRPARQLHALHRWLTFMSVLTRDDYYFVAAPVWRERLELDAGLVDYRALASAAPGADPKQLALRALQRAEARHAAAPPDAQVDAPHVAVQHLVEYVTCSLVVAARRLDFDLIMSLPPLLAPFVGLSSEVDTLHEIALATEESLCRCRIERARARWLDVYARLDRLDAHPLHHASFIRNAVAYALGVCEASLGMQTARHWADQLDDDPLQAGSAMYLRKVLRLQLGDFEGAERFRRKAELLSIHADASQIFSNTIVTELVVHAIACDLLGVKQLADRIAPLAERCPDWVAYQYLAQGYFERLRGNPTAALQAFERCLDLSPPRSEQAFTHGWALATAGTAEALIDLGHYAQAARLAGAAVERCDANGVRAMARLIIRALALAQAKLGQVEAAAQRLDAAIAVTQDAGVTGLQLGCLYEARAFVAIDAGDREAVERYTRLTAREYRYGLGSPLGARCERLIEAAGLDAAAFLQPLAAWSQNAHKTHHNPSQHALLGTEVSRAMAGAELAEGRAQRALRLLCDSQGATAGMLYLASAGGLRLAATHGTAPPDDALRDLARERLESDLRHQVDVTRVDGDTSSRFEHYTRAVWTDPFGQPYEPRILHCVQNGTPRCAGVALLAQTPAPNKATRSAQFATALSAYLIDVGETPGI